MEYKTIAGNYYTITSKSGCSVTDATGTLSMTVDAGGQLTVQAPSDKLVYDDEQAIVFKANFNHAALVLRLLGGGKNDLPAGYTRLEFLESSGEQYINTGVFPTGDMNIKVDVMALSWVYCNYVFGNYQKSGANIAFSIDYNNAYSRAGMYRYGTQFAYFTQGAHKLNVRYNYEFAGNVVYRNGGLAKFLNNTKFNPETFTGEHPILLFASRHDNWNISSSGGKRIWLFSIKKPEGDVLNFIPALDPTGTPCMYDTVTRKAFRNASSGQFIAGFTLAQARKLGKLPAGTTLTVSLPVGYDSDAGVVAALAAAEANGCVLTIQTYAAETAAATYSLRRVWVRRQQDYRGTYVDADGSRWMVDWCVDIIGADPESLGYERYRSVDAAAEYWGLVPYEYPEEELSNEA